MGKKKTFNIDKDYAGKTLMDLRFKGDFIKVAESGIENSGDIEFFRRMNADAYLIGTALMKASDPIEKLKEFYGGLR